MWWRVPLFLILMISTLASTKVMAQDNFSVYENTSIGIALDLPADWEVREENGRLTMGLSSDMDRIAGGEIPLNLILSVVTGSYSDLRLQSPDQIAERVQQLVPSGLAAPAPYQVSYGDVNGYETEFVDTSSGLITRVAILTATDGRIAILRGIAPQNGWETSYSLQLQRIMESIRFILPENMLTPLDNINDEDGGVLWHYQIAQSREQRAIQLGGITYDDQNIAYIAAGERGFLVLGQETGAFVNFLGPVFVNDNFSDVSIAPNGLLYFANATTQPARRVMIIDRVGTYQRAWGIAGDEPGQFAPNMPQSITVTGEGDVWAISEGHSTPPFRRIYRFDLDGNFFQMIDMETLSPALENARIDVNRNEDRLYVTGENGGIYVINWNAEILARDLALDFLEEAVATDIAVAPNGNLIISTANEGFIKLNSQGIIQDRFGYAYEEDRGGRFLPGEYRQPRGVAADANGTVYFAETHPETGFAQVQAFTFDGQGLLPIAQRTPPITDASGNGSSTLESGGEIEYAQVVRGLLSSNSPRHDYTFFGQAGDQITITMRSINPEGSLDTWLFLYDADYNRLTQNDDVVTPTEALTSTDSVIQYTIGLNGTYIIRAARFGGDGVYELVIEQR